MRHRLNLDILRAFAVCAVLIDHLMPTLQRYLGFSNFHILRYTEHIGYTGVLAFFVHTSLVLMQSLERMHQSREEVTWKFYIRRFFRLYPLAVFTIVMVVALKIPGNSWRNPEPPTGKEIVSNLLLVQNLWVKKDVIGPLWSLPYEVQMYVVFPALFVLTRKRRAPVYISGLYLAAVALGVGLWVTTGRENLAEFFPCFLSGILCYTLRNRFRPVLPGTLWPIFVIGWIGLLCSVQVHFWTSWIFCLGMGLMLNLFRECPITWLNAGAARLALYSYGVYLLHVPMLYLIFDKMGVTNAWIGGVLEFTLSISAAAAVFYLLEQPFIDLGRRLSGDHGKAALDPVVMSAVP